MRYTVGPYPIHNIVISTQYFCGLEWISLRIFQGNELFFFIVSDKIVSPTSDALKLVKYKGFLLDK